VKAPTVKSSLGTKGENLAASSVELSNLIDLVREVLEKRDVVGNSTTRAYKPVDGDDKIELSPGMKALTVEASSGTNGESLAASSEKLSNLIGFVREEVEELDVVGNITTRVDEMYKQVDGDDRIEFSPEVFTKDMKKTEGVVVASGRNFHKADHRLTNSTGKRSTDEEHI